MWPFKKKKPQPLAVAQAVQFTDLKEEIVKPRCFVQCILDDLERHQDWSFKLGSFGWTATCKDKDYSLFVCFNGSPYPYVSILELDATPLTPSERDLLKVAVNKIWKIREEEDKRKAEEKDKQTLEKLFPQCYPKTSGVEMMN